MVGFCKCQRKQCNFFKLLQTRARCTSENTLNRFKFHLKLKKIKIHFVPIYLELENKFYFLILLLYGENRMDKIATHLWDHRSITVYIEKFILKRLFTVHVSTNESI